MIMLVLIIIFISAIFVQLSQANSNRFVASIKYSLFITLSFVKSPASRM